MTKIALLPDLVADQIAAGEVVENAASAVKELIENALDANASEIIIRIDKGGLERLCIEDDGCGMDSEDALLCVKRHATSKIRSIYDLEKLSTLGFRGEALAALASISKLEIKTSDGNEGSHLTFEGDKLSHATRIARNRGTTIDAKSLFFNTPARLKFQKSPASSAAAVLKVVQILSLAHPHVRFSLYSNGKITLRCLQTDWKLRTEEVLGSFAHEIKASQIRGLLGRPQEGKANRSGQMLFINRRPIFSPLIAKAVKEGFGTRMPESLFPTFLLFLELPPDSIDVNVHPQKKEVRFRHESQIYQMVRSAVFQVFEGIADFPPLPWELSKTPATCFLEEISQKQHHNFRLQDAPFISQNIPEALPLEQELLAEVQDNIVSPQKTSTPLAVLGDFLLLQTGEEWQLLDLRAAESRIVFEEIKHAKTAVQPLLCPIEYSSTEPEECIALLQQARIEARVIGKKTIAIDAIPQTLHLAHVEEFVKQLTAPSKEARSIAAALTKTYRSIKRAYSLQEARLIWEKLSECNDTMYDPLGRKMIVPLTQEHLTGLFL